MDLVDLADSLRRAVAAPGEFDTVFPNTTEDDLAGTLADALAEAQLDGFLYGITTDADFITNLELTSSQQALVVLYARARVLAAQIANLKSVTRYKAGPVESETQQAATVLVQLLKDSSDRKKALLDVARYGPTYITMVDLYVTRSLDHSSSDLAYLTAGADHGRH